MISSRKIKKFENLINYPEDDFAGHCPILNGPLILDKAM